MVSLMVFWSRHGTVSIRSVHLGALPSLASENMSRSDFFFHLKISLIWLICFCFFFVFFFCVRATRPLPDALLQHGAAPAPPEHPGCCHCRSFATGCPTVATRFRLVLLRFQISYVRSLRDTKRAKRISVPGPRVPSQAPLALPNGLSSCHKHFLKPRANWLETTLKNFATEGSSVLRERSFSSCQCCDAKPQISGPVVFWDFFIYQSRGKWNEISSISWFHEFFSLKLQTYIVI